MRGGNSAPQCHCHGHCCTAATGLQRGGLLCHGGLRLPPPLLSPLTPLRSSEAAIVWGSPPPPQHQHLQTHHHHMLPSLIPLQQPRSATAAVGREGRIGLRGRAGGGWGVGVGEGQGQRRMEEVVRRNSGHNAAECKDSPLQHGAVGRLPTTGAPSPSCRRLFTAINDIYSTALCRGGGGVGVATMEGLCVENNGWIILRLFVWIFPRRKRTDPTLQLQTRP